MFYEDLFDIEEEYTNKHKKYATGFSSIFELKREKKFYALYSAFSECHGIMIDKKLYEYNLYDIRKMKPNERILEVSYHEKLHFFNIESFMEAKFKNTSIELKNTKNEDVELIPLQIRSMITDGCIN